MAATLEFTKREAGMYEVNLIGEGQTKRLGTVSGGSGYWYAEASDGKCLTSLKSCKTRKEAGDRLYIYFRQREGLSRMPTMP